MTRPLLAILSLAIAAVFVLGHASAQAPPPRPMGIDLATAKKMMAAAEAAAIAANVHNSIAIVDVNGDLVCFERMDGTTVRGVTASQGKARAALLFGMPTKEVQDSVAVGKPLSATITLPTGGAWELTPMQGGLPIMKDGKVVAAIGAGGSAPAQDEKIAQAGIDALSK
jgi:glc operon protein GlcG